jgi:hypothetical protein
VRVPRLVGGGDHVLERLLRQDLRLVEHLDVDLIEATTEALLAGAEHDDRAVEEADLLLAVRRADAVVRDVREDLLCGGEALQRAERVGDRPVVVRRPEHRQAREQHAQGEDDRLTRNVLRDLARDAQHDPADRRGVDAVRPLGEDARPSPSCHSSNSTPNSRH